MATEKELDRLLAVELETNPLFLEWFVSKTKFADRNVAGGFKYEVHHG